MVEPARKAPYIFALSAAALGATALGCAGAPAPKTKVEEAPVAASEPAAPTFTSPGRWHYHPSPPETADAWIRLPDGGCAITAEGGQRWVITPVKGSGSGAGKQEAQATPPDPSQSPAKEAPCRGRAQAASALAPEELTGVVRKTSGSWLFVGASGALYESGSALGSFNHVHAPPEPLSVVAGSGSTVLAATLDGKLLRFTEEEGWRHLPSMTARVFDLAVDAGGRAMALAMPEALFLTEDGGSSWKPAPTSPIGAQRVGFSKTGELSAQGLTRSITWDPRRPTPIATSAAPLPERRIELDVSVQPAASGTAVAYRRAALDGERYYEVTHRDEGEEGWTLLRGRIDAPLEAKRIPGTDDCGSMKLGATGKQIVTACVKAFGDGIIARVRRSDDGGESWSEPVTLETLDTDSLGIAVAPDGSTLITGACKQADSTGSCKPGAPILVRPEDRRRVVAAATEAPALSGAASFPTFSVDGRSAYFLGQRVKDDRLALFVSHDGGETFAERPLAAPSAEAAEEDRPPPGDDEERRSGLEISEESSLTAGEDGAVGVVLLGERGVVYVTTDEDGRVLRAAPPPASGAILAGYGRRVVAVSMGDDDPSPDNDGLHVWESLDGGGSWADIPGTRALTRDFFRSTAALECGAGGCLFGETVARVGWAGQADSPSEAAVKPMATSEPKIRAPIVCELSSASRWTRIENVAAAGWGAPDMNEAMRGRSVWSVLTYDRPTGAVGTVSAMLAGDSAGSSPKGSPAPATAATATEGAARVTTRSLFGRSPPSTPTAKTAVRVLRQMEGYAAARVRFALEAPDKMKLGLPMRGVEVAWENWNEGVSGRVTLPDAGPFEPGDIRTDAGDLFYTALLSVSLRGVFIQPHSPNARSRTTYFLEPGGKIQRFEYPRWPARNVADRPLSIQSETVFADDELLAVGMDPWSDQYPFSTLMVGRRSGDSWSITETAVAPFIDTPTELVVETNWAYSGKSIGVTALFSDPKRARGWATFQPFRGDGTLGAATLLATPFDLPDVPRPCSASERASTPRFEAPMFARNEVTFPGTRRPVLITDAPPSGASRGAIETGRSIVLITSGAVLHGPPSNPCIAAWDAAQLTGGSTPSTSTSDIAEFAALLPADLAHSWLFRPAPGSVEVHTDGPAPKTLEYRPMTCRVEPSAPIPEAVLLEPGAARQIPAR